MPAISTTAASVAAAAATASTSAAPSQPHTLNLALILKIVIPLGVVALLIVVGIIVWVCRTPAYDENAPTNLRKKRPEEDPAPAYDAQASPPTYAVPVAPELAFSGGAPGSEDEKTEDGEEEASRGASGGARDRGTVEERV